MPIFSTPSNPNNPNTTLSQTMATLLGPPEIHNNPKTPFHPTQTTTTTAAAVLSDPFIDTMVSEFNTTAIDPDNPPMGFTENFSPTFVSSGNPCLDFFFHVVPQTPINDLHQRLQAAWSHHPLTTLKLVCNLRGVRGTGKSDRRSFYAAAMWLHAHHPKTLAANVPSLADFGYFKDLPEILYRLLEGFDVRKIQRTEWLRVKGSAKMNKMMREMNKRDTRRISKQLRKNTRTRSRLLRYVPSKVAKEGKTETVLSREEKKVAMAKKLLDRYNSDADFRLLHDRISDHFAECLKKDLEYLNSGSLTKISLAAKWCPSVDSSFDRSTLLCESIARRVFPRAAYPEYEGIEEAHYAYRVRDRLRKDVLVPLRKVLELPEVFMGANSWELIPYNRVASVAMKCYKEKFLKHDKERFEKYLEEVKSEKSTIAAGALLPHEIVGSLWDGDDGEVAELQWSRMVSDMVKKGKMKNCLAICDVSGSMNGIPMEVCVALGLLVSELSEEPWKGKVITFSENPQLHLIEGQDLRSKTEFIRRMNWGGNTDFQKVFDQILQVAVNGNLREDQMIKRVFVFSDMEFDEASGSHWRKHRWNHWETDSDNQSGDESENFWETDYQAIVRKYSEKGYGSVVPQIVFWNLRYSDATPVPSTQKGVSLVSGFSKNLLTMFLNNDGEMNPLATMEAAISAPEYQKLVVLD